MATDSRLRRATAVFVRVALAGSTVAVRDRGEPVGRHRSESYARW